MLKRNLQEILHRLSELLELLVGFFMLAALAAALIGMVVQISLPRLIDDPNVFHYYMGIAATIVIGVEFVKMLCQHTLDSVIEVMLLAIARQMIVEHTSPLENLIAVLSVSVLFLVRKFLFVPRLDRVNHPPLSAIFSFLSRKNRKEIRDAAELITKEVSGEKEG